MKQPRTERVALVTGAAQRIGAAIARELHGAGCTVLLHYRHSAAAAQALADELESLRPGSAVPLRADLERHAEVLALAESARAARGGLDLLVNNASAFYPTPLDAVTESDWDVLFASNLKAPFFLSRALAPTLAVNGGAIVNIVDVHARLPLPQHSVYTMAKAGLEMMTRALALELGPAVRVNAVAPGAILWPTEPNPELSAARAQELLALTALRRTGDPRDIAGAVRYLGLEAAYVTGQVLPVDGGRTLF